MRRRKKIPEKETVKCVTPQIPYRATMSVPKTTTPPAKSVQLLWVHHEKLHDDCSPNANCTSRERKTREKQGNRYAPVHKKVAFVYNPVQSTALPSDKLNDAFRCRVYVTERNYCATVTMKCNILLRDRTAAAG